MIDILVSGFVGFLIGIIFGIGLLVLIAMSYEEKEE